MPSPSPPLLVVITWICMICWSGVTYTSVSTISPPKKVGVNIHLGERDVSWAFALEWLLRLKNHLKWPFSFWYGLATQIFSWFYRLFSNSNCIFLKTGWSDVFALEWLLRSKSCLKWPISYWYSLATQILLWFYRLFSNSNCTFLKTGWNDVFALEWLLRSKSYLKWPISFWYGLATQIFLWFYRFVSNCSANMGWLCQPATLTNGQDWGPLEQWTLRVTD